MLDPLLTDARFLLTASQPELLATLAAARSDEARTAAQVYQRNPPRPKGNDLLWRLGDLTRT